MEEVANSAPKYSYPVLNSTQGHDVVLAFFVSFRHWGHPNIDYLKGLSKLQQGLTKKKIISKEFAIRLASDLARIVLTAKFKEKKKWFVKPGTTKKTHPLYKWIKNNEWPSPKEIVDAGDVWAELELGNYFELPDLVDPTQLYRDKPHSMNRKEVLDHVRSGNNSPIPAKKVLKTLLDQPATNWNEVLGDIVLNGMDRKSLIIGLKEKEKEMKEDGRFFAMMS